MQHDPIFGQDGFASAEHPIVRSVRDLRSRGRLIGSKDLWIRASSLRHELPVVTANAEHFRRIEGWK